MIKNKTIIEVKMNERIYQLECYPESPLGEVHDALCLMKSYVIERMKQDDLKPEGFQCQTQEG